MQVITHFVSPVSCIIFKKIKLREKIKENRIKKIELSLNKTN